MCCVVSPQAFWDARLRNLMHACVLIDVPRAVAKTRRESHSGGDWSDPPGYFDAFIWPNHELYMRVAVPHVGADRLRTVSGTQSKPQVLAAVEQAVHEVTPNAMRR